MFQLKINANYLISKSINIGSFTDVIRLYVDTLLKEDLSPEQEAKIPHVCSSLDEALKALDADRDFLKAGDVFNDDTIDAYIALKMEEVQAFQANTHPLEFEMYYSL